MIKNTRNIATIVTAAAVLSAAAPAASAFAGGWANAQGGYKADEKQLTVRLEGGSSHNYGISSYAFMDLDAVKPGADLENVYAEGRIMKSLDFILPGLKAMVEVDVGNSMRDFVRYGASLTPDLGNGNFTQFRWCPATSQEGVGSQVTIYTSQEILPGLTASMLVDYNLRPNTIYVEPRIDLKLTEQVAGFFMGRGFGEVNGRIDVKPVVGLQYNL